MSVISSLLADWNCLQVQVKRLISLALAGALHVNTAANTATMTAGWIAVVAAALIAPLKIIPRMSSSQLSPHRALSQCRLRRCAGNRPARRPPARRRDFSDSPKLLGRGSIGSAL